MLSTKKYFLDFIVFILAVFSIVMCFLNSYWADEFYTMCIVSFPLRDSWNILKFDVHPPLYYLGAKAFYNTLKAIFPSVNIITALKIFSLVPSLILLIVSKLQIKKYFGKFVAILFSIAILAAPHLCTYNTEIRMYSWTMLFITLAYLSIYELLYYKNVKAIISFTIYGVLATYTQYYAIIIIGLMIIFLFINTFDDSDISSSVIVISGIVMLILYIPQLKTFAIQAALVTGSYSLRNIKLLDFVYAIVYPFQFQYPYLKALYFLTYALSIIVLMILLSAFRFRKNIKDRADIVLFALLSPLMLSGILIILSLTIKPIFLPRYIVMVLPIFWISVFNILKYCKKAKQIFTVTIIICFIINFSATVFYEICFDREYNKLNNFLTSARKENSVFCADLKIDLVNTGILTMDYNPKDVVILESHKDIEDLFDKYDNIYYIVETYDNSELKSQDIQYTTMKRVHNISDLKCNTNLQLIFINPDTTYKIYKLLK